MIAVAASLPVMSTFEPEQRMYWMPICSTMLSSRWFSTSNVTGSSVRRASIESGIGGAPLRRLWGDTRVEPLVDCRLLPVQHDDRRAGVFDDGRPREPGSGGERRTVIDRRLDHPLGARAPG